LTRGFRIDPKHYKNPAMRGIERKAQGCMGAIGVSIAARPERLSYDGVPQIREGAGRPRFGDVEALRKADSQPA